MKTNRDFEAKTENKVEEVKAEPKVIRPKKYIIGVTNLALRDAPNGEKIGIAPAGTVMIADVKDGFGKLADGSGWVSMQYTRKAD